MAATKASSDNVEVAAKTEMIAAEAAFENSLPELDTAAKSEVSQTNGSDNRGFGNVSVL